MPGCVISSYCSLHLSTGFENIFLWAHPALFKKTSYVHFFPSTLITKMHSRQIINLDCLKENKIPLKNKRLQGLNRFFTLHTVPA